MMSGGLFDPLMNETNLALDPKSRSDHECTRYCLLILSNLAVNLSNHEILMKYSLDTLTSYSKHRDIKCRQHAIFCIANLCSNNDNLEAVVKAGALRTIITYAFPSTDSSANVQFQAVAALRGLATHSALRVQIVREVIIYIFLRLPSTFIFSSYSFLVFFLYFLTFSFILISSFLIFVLFFHLFLFFFCSYLVLILFFFRLSFFFSIRVR